ncbi:hypothetical protein ACQUFY_16885 [Robbsia andropogonis]|uniref:hypothetical protein n=1 Tax=Robbsia andropogonis TaxID=28092 RepID=UPI003D19EB17
MIDTFAKSRSNSWFRKTDSLVLSLRRAFFRLNSSGNVVPMHMTAGVLRPSFGRSSVEIEGVWPGMKEAGLGAATSVITRST